MWQAATREARNSGFSNLRRAASASSALLLGASAFLNPLCADAKQAARNNQMPPPVTYNKSDATIPINKAITVKEGNMAELRLYTPVILAPQEIGERLIEALSDNGYSYSVSIGHNKNGALYGILEVRDHSGRVKGVKIMEFDSQVSSGDRLLVRIDFSDGRVYARINKMEGGVANAQGGMPAFGGTYFKSVTFRTYGKGDPDYTIISNVSR